MSNFTTILNRLADSAIMLTWYEDNFFRVLNRLTSSESMSGLRRGEEHTLDSSFSKYK